MPSQYKKLFCLFHFCVCYQRTCTCVPSSRFSRDTDIRLYMQISVRDPLTCQQKAILEIQRPIFSELRFQGFCISILDFLLSFSFKAQHRVRKQENVIGLKDLRSRKQAVKMQSCSHINITPSTVEDLRRNKLN